MFQDPEFGVHIHRTHIGSITETSSREAPTSCKTLTVWPKVETIKLILPTKGHGVMRHVAIMLPQATTRLHINLKAWTPNPRTIHLQLHQPHRENRLILGLTSPSKALRRLGILGVTNLLVIIGVLDIILSSFMVDLVGVDRLHTTRYLGSSIPSDVSQNPARRSHTDFQAL